MAGYEVLNVASDQHGMVDTSALAQLVNEDVAALMVTNPNTLGIFEQNITEIARILHVKGAMLYMDGANMNALCGIARPGDFGVDLMHLNLHKTFSTPHGGGGPGSGPVVLSEALAPFAPLPFVRRVKGGYELIEEEDGVDAAPQTFGRMAAFNGQMGMFTRALAYILSHGADGLRQVSGDAVLGANYILRSLQGVLDAPFGKTGPCMHEALFSDKGFAEGVATLDLAKALIDEGFHPMTMYFPLVVHGAMLVEPTECESKASLDQFILALRSIAERARAGDETLHQAPQLAPRRRLDETLAARKPVLAYAG
jgi:glycine dehydrogenase subunit 2